MPSAQTVRTITRRLSCRSPGKRFAPSFVQPLVPHSMTNMSVDYSITNIMPVSVTNPDHRPDSWKQMLPGNVPDYWGDAALAKVLRSHFNIKLLHARCFTIRPSDEQRGNLPQDYHALDRLINAYVARRPRRPVFPWRFWRRPLAHPRPNRIPYSSSRIDRTETDSAPPQPQPTAPGVFKFSSNFSHPNLCQSFRR